MNAQTAAAEKTGARSGPLTGLRVVEFAAQGPAPFGAMLLADLGADVIRLERPGSADGRYWYEDLLTRGRPSIPIDLKHPEGVKAALELVADADVLIEGYRPGVMERFGLGPDVCLARNEKLVYARMTGWGQTGPFAARAGHDSQFISLSGVLASIGRKGELPVLPLSLVGDFGGGGMMLAFGVLAAVFQARETGTGQVVDAAMTEGSAILMTAVYELLAKGQWNVERGTNLFDGGSPFNQVYEAADGRVVAIGCVEDKFYNELLRLMEIDDPEMRDHMDRDRWPMIQAELTRVFKTKTADEWEAIMGEEELCFSIVYDLNEAPQHPHNQARQAFYEVDGAWHPAPTPRFSETPPALPQPALPPGKETRSALAAWGMPAEDIDRYLEAGAIRQI